jgi:hypothetical protein
VRSIQKFFTHRPVSTFDRVPFQLTGELFLYGTALRRGDARSYGHAIFLGVFGSMQVVDAALWWNDAHGGNGAGLAGCDLFNRG